MARRKPGGQGNGRGKLPIEHSAFYPYLQRYLEQLTVRNHSDDTCQRYDSNIRQFIHWSDERGIDDPRAVTKPILERYQKHLYYRRKDNGDPLSFSSQHIKLASLKAWFKWLTRENYLLYNPASELIMPRTPERLPRYILSLDDIHTLMNSVDLNGPQGIRDRAVLELLYSSGLRRKECATLTLPDIDLKRHTVFVREGKGGKDRLLPLGETARDWLNHYIQQARPELVTGQNDYALFIDNFGAAYNADCLGRIVKSHLKKAGINVEGAAHLLRHAMATHMLENGADLRYIQTMLGHSDLRATQIYTRVSVEKLREIHRATHPASRFKKDKIKDRADLPEQCE
ncbi:MAG: site-specific tyrosine recombinase XerC [Ectothiorhodospiraceae bacterium]|nr:site-specific tyrosine recombinase XerC [Ectothiorhodospiraceae bacterium]